jgi:hypothetical protein
VEAYAWASSRHTSPYPFSPPHLSLLIPSSIQNVLKEAQFSWPPGPEFCPRHLQSAQRCPPKRLLWLCWYSNECSPVNQAMSGTGSPRGTSLCISSHLTFGKLSSVWSALLVALWILTSRSSLSCLTPGDPTRVGRKGLQNDSDSNHSDTKDQGELFARPQVLQAKLTILSWLPQAVLNGHCLWSTHQENRPGNCQKCGQRTWQVVYRRESPMATSACSHLLAMQETQSHVLALYIYLGGKTQTSGYIKCWQAWGGGASCGLLVGHSRSVIPESNLIVCSKIE